MDGPFFPDDVIALKSKDTQVGVVERTHADVDTHDPRPGRDEFIKNDKDIARTFFNNFLKDGVPPEGTVLVRWQQSTDLQLIREAKLTVLDRSLLIGDVVKRAPRDAMSGIVINTFTKCTLLPAKEVTIRHGGGPITLTGIPPSDDSRFPLKQDELITDVPASELTSQQWPSPEDLIIFGDWIGRVEQVNRLISLRLSDNSVVEIHEGLADHMDDSDESLTVGTFAQSKKTALRMGRFIYGEYNANTPPIGSVVETRIVNVEVTWLERRIGSASNGDENEPGAVLDRMDIESTSFQVYERTRRPYDLPGSETGTLSHSEIDASLNLRVRFKDISGACVKYDGSSGRGKIERKDRRDHLGFDLNVFDIVKFQTDITVQWQDLTISRQRSIDVVPEVTIDDEHDAWPGEIVHPPELQPVLNMPNVKQATKVGVVQTVNAFERMATVRWCSDACLQYSIDTEDAPGLRSVVSTQVGRSSGPHEQVSLYDIEAPGEVNMRRGDIVLISNPTSAVVVSDDESSDVTWLGEIVDTCLDGRLMVRLGAAATVRDLNLRREEVVVAIRSDGTDTADGWDEGEQEDRMRINSDGEIEFDDDSDEDSDGDSEDTEDSMEIHSGEEKATYENEDGEPMDEEDVENEDWESESNDESDVEMTDAIEQTPGTSQSATPPDTSKRKEDTQMPDSAEGEAPSPPKAYLILDTQVPSSQHFATKSASDNTQHLKRIQKEHKILRAPSNLPKGVYVRTWESRLDLLRVLIIGPAETPYADAPFVIDFHLHPTFPAEPPSAFFHSWTAESGLGGVGRVNPNLYEDGKICLSLLGTWESEKSAGWNAGKSTLLQVLVSLLGLVLVKEPYFNEAGYEPLAGLESSRRSSQLYSERVSIKARTFVISALTGTAGLEGFEETIRWLYKDDAGPRLLEKVVRDVGVVLEGSESGADASAGQPVMSKGACIPLRRVLERLKEL